MEAPGTLVVTRFPSVSVPVGVVASGPKCVPSSAPCVTETPGVSETPCVSGVVASVPGCVLPSTPCVEKTPRVRETPCVSSMACE